MNKIKIRVLKIYLYLKKKFTYIIGWVGSYGLKKTYINNITQLKKSNQIKRIPSNKDERDEFASL